MNVEVIVRIGGREVVTLNHRFSGDSLEIEQQTECFKDRIGQLILTEACSRFDAALRRPGSGSLSCTSAHEAKSVARP